MQEFEKVWDDEVKALAAKCIDNDILRILYNEDATDEDKAKLKELAAGYKDVLAMQHISHLIWRIEHDLADGRSPKIHIIGIMGVISEKNTAYWDDVFKGDKSSEEAQNLINLAVGLEKLIAAKYDY